jgi:L-rhamnonate dehydratase
MYPALHVIAAQSPATCPVAEFLWRPQASSQALQANEAWPEGGSIALPALTGSSVVLDEARIDTRRELDAVCG